MTEYWQDDFDRLAGVWQGIQKQLPKSQHDLTKTSPIPAALPGRDSRAIRWFRV
ncbi:hypothetical protein [Sphingobacterium sp. CZ-UAM]|uniref:hypothetical protein n=1 Tax=Sphingobacterium sp. CZ-UAM TaxID=1933868 RepID=UPI00158C0355|nr:hypothetical protein [Sphingobacterium sp. CZ-UAM]